MSKLASQVICRPVVEGDQADVIEFCKGIWDGGDYVPEVWEEWFHDPNGLLAIAEYEGHAIGCAKLTLLAEGQWWLEGFRVDPKYQGLKVGSLIHHYIHRWWLTQGNGVLRLMTSSKNKTVHHLCESTGFHKLFEVRGYRAEPLSGNADAFTSAAASEKDLPGIVTFALKSPSLAITNFIVDFGWRFANPTTDGALSSLFADVPSFKKNFLWWHKDKGLLIVWEDDDPDREQYTMGIGVAGCKLEDMPAFLTDARHLAAKQGKTSLFWLAPVHKQFELALLQAGYKSDWENTAYIFNTEPPRGTQPGKETLR